VTTKEHGIANKLEALIILEDRFKHRYVAPITLIVGAVDLFPSQLRLGYLTTPTSRVIERICHTRLEQDSHPGVKLISVAAPALLQSIIRVI